MLLSTQVQGCSLFSWRFVHEIFQNVSCLFIYSLRYAFIHTYWLCPSCVYYHFYQKLAGLINDGTQTNLRPLLYFNKVFGRKCRLKLGGMMWISRDAGIDWPDNLSQLFLGKQRCRQTRESLSVQIREGCSRSR